MARVRIGFEAAFLIVGLGLLAGAAYAYNRIVVQPGAWPRIDALVVSSRVVNPRGPAEYAPELVFRLDQGGSTRDVTIAPSWRSNSYDIVRRHVERFPAGRHVSVAVNPDSPADVRYDLTPSVENLILPGILAVMGLVFAAIGLIAMRVERARAPAQPWDVPLDPARLATDNARIARRVGQAFAIIGLVVGAIGAAMARADLAMIRGWPQVDGRVVDARVVRATGSSRRPSYDTEVRFRYAVDGVTLENGTTYGAGSSRSSAEARARAYAPGTTHRIWHRPDDPNLIRFDLDHGIGLFLPSGGLMLMGAVLMALGGLVWRSSSRSLSSPDVPVDIETSN